MECLKWLLQIFALDSNERRITKSEKCCYIFKAACAVIVLAALSVYSFLYKLRYVAHLINPSVNLTDLIKMIFDFFQFIIDLVFVYKYGREMSQEYFRQFGYFDKIVDITHYSETKSRVTKLVIFLISLFLFSSTLDFLSWSLTFGLTTAMIYSTSYLFTMSKIVTNLDMTVQVINIECRLRIIGDLVQDSYHNAESLTNRRCTNLYLGDTVSNKNWFYSEGFYKEVIRRRAQTLKNISNKSYNEVKWLTRCYLLLSEQCSFISQMYSIRILLNNLSLFADMVGYLNITVRLAIGSQKTPNSAGMLPSVSCLVRFFVLGIIPTSLVHHCEKTYRQTERISSLADHVLINKNPDDSLRASVSELRDLVNTRPISFNMAHFCSLSYPYLASMASVVVTYSIILLQSM